MQPTRIGALVGSNSGTGRGDDIPRDRSPDEDLALHQVDVFPSRSESVTFGNKRFMFKARSPGFKLNLGKLEIGFHTIYIKAMLQRRKRFLGIGYWGPRGDGWLTIRTFGAVVARGVMCPAPGRDEGPLLHRRPARDR
jgi:hypothetical protein